MTQESMALITLAGAIFAFVVFAALILIPFRIYAKLKEIKVEMEQTNRLLVWMGDKLTALQNQSTD